MNAMTVAAFGSWAGVLVSVLIGVFVYGKLTEKVNSHDPRISALEIAKDDHGQRIARLEGERYAK